jgi:NitT/TauT family transport system substrate-binding protein
MLPRGYPSTAGYDQSSAIPISHVLRKLEVKITMRLITRPPAIGRAVLAVVTGFFVVSCEASAPSISTPQTPPVQASRAASTAPTMAATPQLTAAPDLEPVTLLLDGPISGMQAPFVVGIAESFFSAEGIALNLEERAGSRAMVEGVASGDEVVAFADATATAAAVAAGASVQMVACFVQQTPFGAFSYGDLSVPSALAGQTVGYASGDALLLWEGFKARNKIASGEVTEVALERSDLQDALLHGRIDVAVGATVATDFAATDGDGAALSVLHFSDWNAGALAYGLMVHTDVIRDDPELVRRIVAGAVRSWQYAEENPDATVAAFIATYPQADRGVVASQLAETLALSHTGASLGQSPGYMVDTDWQATVDLLEESGGLTGGVRGSELYTNTFLFRH